MNRTIIALLVLLTLSGFTFSDSFAIISSNSAFTLEGSGYAVTEDVIKISEIDLALSTQKQTGSSVKSSIEDGFVTLGDENFLATELEALYYVKANTLELMELLKVILVIMHPLDFLED